MKRFSIELVVGLFVLVGLASVSYLAIRVGDVSIGGHQGYTLTARFISASGLRVGAPVELAGVRVGKVASIDLDGESYEAVVKLALRQDVRVQEDSKASVRTQGIIGDKFVKISPGGSTKVLAADEEIFETEPSISLEELISKYIFDRDQ